MAGFELVEDDIVPIARDVGSRGPEYSSKAPNFVQSHSL